MNIKEPSTYKDDSMNIYATICVASGQRCYKEKNVPKVQEGEEELDTEMDVPWEAVYGHDGVGVSKKKCRNTYSSVLFRTKQSQK